MSLDTNDESDGSSSNNKNAAMPQILTRATLPNLIGDLDAGDVLECYAVTRMAPLHLSQITNETLFVQKNAVAIRYPPPLGSTKSKLELTLEYGPQRMGATLTQEAMPLLHVDGQDSFVTWENEGKVYYTTSFDTQDWTKANYMASMTGAVFELLLDKALDFVATHPRYQPLRVVSLIHDKDEADNNLVVRLKSSASHDFVYSVWEGLAVAGVDLQPILAPPTHVLRLHSDGIQKVSGVDSEGRVVAQEAFEFYQKLYQCATAIQTGNYQNWEPTASPTTLVAPTTSPTVTLEPTMEPTMEPTTTTTTVEPTIAPSTKKPRKKNKKKKNGGNHNNNADNNKNSTTASENNTNIGEDNENDENNKEDVGDGNNDMRRQLKDADESTFTPTPAPSLSNASSEELDKDTIIDDNYTTSPAPTSAPSASKNDEAAKAKEAAQHAKEAAHEAKEAAHTPQDSKAADAAEAAADAAQAAADATSNAKAKAATDSIQSGDGDLVTSVLRECFADPRYGIMKSAILEDGTNETEPNDNVETYAYLYLDGSNYYRVNLTWPYMDVGRLKRPLPQPPTDGDSGRVGVVDWLLALLVILLLGVTILALLQQVGYRIAFSSYQKWFFQPRHYNYEDAKNEEENRGQGYAHGFGEDVIPLSMGGRRLNADGGDENNVKVANNSNVHVVVDHLYDHHDGGGGLNGNTSGSVGELGDLEMVPPAPTVQSPSTPISPLGSPTISSPSMNRSRSASRSSSGGMLMDIMSEDDSHHHVHGGGESLPRRFSKDPDLVDLPNLKSSSKVAVPVTSNGSA